MNYREFAAAIAVALTLASGHSIADDDNVFIEVVVVTGMRDSVSNSTIEADLEPGSPSDAASLVGRLPGAALVDNGRLSGQVQYRGMFGPRVGTTINGQQFHSGGPNAMDPPLHYAPPVLVDRIEVSRGPGGIDNGPALVGGINAILKEVPFGSTDTFQMRYDVNMLGRSVDQSHAVGGVAGIANDRYRLYTLFSNEAGDDVDFPGGRLASTQHDREVLGLVAGMETNQDRLEFELRRHDTGPTGNPPFAMDIEYVATDFSRLAWQRSLGDANLAVKLGYTDVDHGMNNFSLRPAPANAMGYRRSLTGAETFNGSVTTELPTSNGRFVLGFETEYASKSAVITHPDNAAFFLVSLPSIRLRDSALFTEWSPSLGDWRFLLGTRVDHRHASAGMAATGAAVPAMPGALARAFNNEDRQWQDTSVDIVARSWVTAGNATWRFALARRHRAPTDVERFAWLPTPASGGLADGNTYVGDRTLGVETATTLDMGVDIEGASWRLRPTVYYSRIDDYIAGAAYDATPGIIDSTVERVAAMNGDPTPLKFTNVDARLYGLELEGVYRLSPTVDIGLRYTHARGERTDIDDDLYRIAPPRLALHLDYIRDDWNLRLETVSHVAQDHVSATNDEPRTRGHTRFHLHARWQPAPQLSIGVGIENLTDKRYQDHMAGFNRITDADVAPGERLYGYGRNIYLKLQFRK